MQIPQIASNVDLCSLISDLAKQMGQPIAAQLQEDKRTSTTPPTIKTEQMSSELILSGVKFVLQSDLKKPQFFRGDDKDQLSIHEWNPASSQYLSTLIGLVRLLQLTQNPL